MSGNKHPSAELRHKCASSHSQQYVLQHHTAACTNCPSVGTNSNKLTTRVPSKSTHVP